MQLKYRLPLALLATAALAFTSLRAQEDDDEEEEFGSFGFLAGSPQSTSVSLKMTQGPKVQFGNLGNISVNLAQTPNKAYMDGTVNKDQHRAFGFGNAGSAAELDVNGKPRELNLVGGRYQVTYTDSAGAVVNADYLAYANGLTRDWSYANESQALTKPGYIAFNIYSARTQGESLLGSRGYSGGIEVSVAQKLTDPAKKIVFSLTAGLTLNGINSSKSGQVNSTLHTYTDYYSLHGAAAPVSTITSEIVEGVRYTGPSGINTVITENGVNSLRETTTTISGNADLTETSDEEDGATVNGLWKLRGAYFTLKLGPQVTAKFTRSLGLSAGAGFAGTYVGTTYTSSESFSVEGVSKPIGFDPESSSVKKLLPGYYANIDATWTMNDRTDFFAGFSYDNLGNYSQTVGGRTAKVDLSSTAGVRGGLSIKF